MVFDSDTGLYFVAFALGDLACAAPGQKIRILVDVIDNIKHLANAIGYKCTFMNSRHGYSSL